jgi:uncharacterized membrane protein YgcG
LVYQLIEQQLAAEEQQDPSHPDPNPSHPSHSSRYQQVQQQHAKLQEELMLRSAAADYPSFLAHSLGPLPANLLSVIAWPGKDLVATGAADGTVRLLSYAEKGDEQQQQQQQEDGGRNGSSSGGSNGGCSSSEVWVTRLGGAGGVLTLSWHPAIKAGKCR